MQRSSVIYSFFLFSLISLVLGRKPPYKNPSDKSPPAISPRYKSPKKNNQGLDFFLGLGDPSWNRLASTAYFAIILGGFLSGAFHRLPISPLICNRFHLYSHKDNEKLFEIKK